MAACRSPLRQHAQSSIGAMPHILVRAFDIRAGNALMYYPEANVLVPTTTDPRSRTPAFKAVLVTLEPEKALEPTEGQREEQGGRTPLELLPR